MLASKQLPIFALLICLITNISWADTPKEVVKQEEQTDSTELSIPPLDHTQYPADRPSWIDKTAPNLGATDSPEPFDISVTSGPADSSQDAEERMMVMARGAVANLLENRLQSMQANFELDAFHIPDSWIDEKLIVRRYQGEVTVGGEPAVEHAALLKFDRAELSYLEDHIRELQLRHRLAAVGLTGVLGLGGLLGGSIVLGGLATRQRRRKAVSNAEAVV